ncbi:MAG: GerMN domain-containing protein [Candidatus Caenarcaniphilales bacterium]|nr:GerMN domain-containing protein [Candidatus Caenarcaniphilales bacterium]
MNDYRKLTNFLFVLLISFGLFSCTVEKGTPGSSSKKPQVTIYFTKASDDLGVVLIPVLRETSSDRTAYETALKELFLGPTLDEKDRLSLATEIPEGVRLVSVKESNDSVNIDISSQFMKGGGSETIQVRFRQLRETALNLAKGRPVYLYIDGVKAKTIGGEGLEIPQPLDSEI